MTSPDLSIPGLEDCEVREDREEQQPQVKVIVQG